jgi:LacI family transcriptional regulator
LNDAWQSAFQVKLVQFQVDSPMSHVKLPHVAVLVDTATGWGRRIIRGVIRYSDKHGPWHIMVEPRGQEENLALPAGWKGDGVIARIGSRRMLHALQTAKLPVVNVSAMDLPGNTFPQVTTAYRESATFAFQHFRDRGLQRFAYSGLPKTSFGRRHCDAFVEVIEEAGFVCNVYKRPQSATGHDDLLKHKISWLKSLPKPVGVFTWGTTPGRELLEACRLANLAVPYEIAVLGGSDDELLCDASWPPLSGINVPAEQIGHEAASILDRMMRGGKAPARATLLSPTGVVSRRSTDTVAIDDLDVAQALKIIRADACKPIQINDILRVVPVSRSSIERKFRQAIGRSPTEEIRRVRMAKAKSLLAETSMPMQKIADACGFATYNYLTRVFTSENGITPREFRSRVQGR